MSRPTPTRSHESDIRVDRRRFVGAAAAAGFVPYFAAQSAAAADEKPLRKFKVGVVGNGGRGTWMAKNFVDHGGFEIHALADYFPEASEKLGTSLGVDKTRCFSGLDGHKRLIDSGVEVVVLETPTYFFHEHATAAVAAGKHVYMAKPVAVDVHGCMAIKAAGEKGTANKQVVLVDYQLPTDPTNQKIRQFFLDGNLGKLARVTTAGVSGGHADPPREETIANRLKGLVWCTDICLGGGFISTYDIHCIDAAVWTLGRRPVAAMGRSCIARPNPNSDAADVSAVIYEYADGLIHEHFGQALPNRTPGEITCKLYTHNAHAIISYYKTSAYEIRGQKRFEETLDNVHDNGVYRNIRTFYQSIIDGQYGNETVARAVDGSLTAILGREAAARGEKLTMDQLIKENKRYEPNLKGLKA